LKDHGGRVVVVDEATLIAASNTGGVEITLRVHDLPPDTNWFHIRDIGKCDSPDFVFAGGRYNPNGNQHGLENPAGPHAGDLPNLTVGRDGTGTLTAINTLLIQNSPEGENLFAGDGVALVIHSGPDDQT
jgi:Cu-Zn family superoxide dismutase